MKSKQKIIQGRDLLKHLSELSGYHSYEIEDVLKSLAFCIAESINQGYDVNIKGLGTFKMKPGYNICGISNLTGEEYNTVTKNILSFKTDSTMLNMLNNMGD